jgi:hypothetical protein
MANSPTAADDDWSCILITSSGFVIQDAIVPAAPPDRRLSSFIFDAVMVMGFVATPTTVDEPPRPAPRRILLVVLLLLAALPSLPPSGMCSAEEEHDEETPHLLAVEEG